MFLDGTLYCNTTAYYRSSTQKGVSDRNESCMFSLDVNRGDKIDSFTINGINVEPPNDLIVRQGHKDGWLHCWANIELPKDTDEFLLLQNDLKRLKEEFGPHYAFVNAPNSHILSERIKTLTKSILAGKVTYFKGGYLGHSVFHKDEKYSYQREFRFIIDECESDFKVPKSLIYKEGFRDIVQESKFRITASTDTEDFELNI